MKILHILPSIHDEASGPSVSVRRLAEEQGKLGHDVELHVLDYGPIPPVEGVSVFSHELLWKRTALGRRIGVSVQLTTALRRSGLTADVIHNHSLWMYPNVLAPLLGGRPGFVSVFSPRGTLNDAAFERSRFAKEIVWRAGQRLALDRANLVHATSDEEAEFVRARDREKLVCVVPNGVDVPAPTGRAVRGRTALFLGRIHPIKRLELLLDAWSLVDSVDSRLQIVGDGDPAYVASLKERAKRMGLRNVEWVGPLYGEHKWDAFRRAAVSALTSGSENFGMAVAESLACGTPVVVTKTVPWARVAEFGVGSWVDSDAGAIARSLSFWLQSEPGKQDAVERAAIRFVEDKFSWRTAASRLLQHIESARAGAGRSQQSKS
ncbi:MAG: glycosyltransferase [Deltaproteobacteria bacterium]|nr:glycosyltransferase [Deltaproteobacteria bacterium]